MSKCRYCGFELGADDHFCSSCGKPVEDNVVETCKKCGKELKSDAAFCSFCGESVVDPPKEEIKAEEKEKIVVPIVEAPKKTDESEKKEITAEELEEMKKTGQIEKAVFDKIEKEKKKKIKHEPAAEAKRTEKKETVTENTAEVIGKMPSRVKFIVFGIIALLLVAVVVLWVKIIPDSMSGNKSKSAETKITGKNTAEVVSELPSEPEVPEDDNSDEGKTTQQEFPYNTYYRVIAQWNEVKSFDENGLAWVMKDNKVGIIDKDGEYVIPMEYDSIGEFYENIAVVGIDEKHGFVDTEGKIILRPTYDSATTFSEGSSVVSKDGKYGFVSTLGKEIIKTEYDYATKFSDGFAAVTKGKDTYFIDNKGEKISENYDGAGYFSEGLAPVMMNGKWGYVDTSMNQVISYEYDSAQSFIDGLAIVAKGDKQFFIDKTGSRKSPEVDQLWIISEGLATAKLNDLYGYVDGKSTDFVIEPQYVNAYAYSQGMCTVEDVQGNWYYMDKENKPVIKEKFEEAYRFTEDFARIRIGANYTVIDKQGNQAVPQKWEKVGVYSNHMLPISEGGLWGFVEIVAP